MMRKSLTELREQMRAVARGERQAGPPSSGSPGRNTLPKPLDCLLSARAGGWPIAGATAFPAVPARRGGFNRG